MDENDTIRELNDEFLHGHLEAARQVCENQARALVHEANLDEGDDQVRLRDHVVTAIEALQLLLAQTPRDGYRCTVCQAGADIHPFAACEGGEFEPYITPPVHVCHTEDNVPIVIGLRVIDYDGRLGTVTEPPSEWDLEDDVCWPCPGHNGHWWGVRPDTAPGNDNPNYAKSFDGSRLTTRGVPR